ncbi:MAG TPA: hypothetical protein VF895_03445 [Gaiellaceae bacterium]
MANVFEPEWDADTDEWRRARLGDQAGSEHLGVSVYELAPGQSMVFHYHLQNEEVLIALRGRLMLRTFDGERELENVSVYHETNEIGIFDAARPADRRFGGLFRLNDAVSDYGGAKPKIPPPS